jgi:hypothetical protein
MIADLKKQLQEQLDSMKGELQERLEPAFQGFKLDIEIDDSIDSVFFNAVQNSKKEENRMSETIITFRYSRSQNLSLVSSSSRILVYDKYNQVIAIQVTSTTIAYEFISFVFNTLASFINEKNPILDSRE